MTSTESPRRANTSAITGAIRRSKQPTAAERGRAGLVSGPSMLKNVGTASSRRVTAACRMPGWNRAAKQKPIPVSTTVRATLAGLRSSGMPRYSSRSAVPQADDADRLPCLTTLTPAAATMIAAIVEMFTVFARSPPVPTTSTASARTSSGSSTGVALASIAWTRPASSAGVSPLARRATARPATCTGVASPVMISPMAQAVSCAESSSPRSRALSRFGQVRAPMAGASVEGYRESGVQSI